MSYYNELEKLHRAESQKQLLLYLLYHEKPIQTINIAKELDMQVTIVNTTLFRLHEKGLVNRISRGVYEPNVGPIISFLLKKYYESK